jgi:ATP-dependent Clp protease ATP-binding subunit ClpB
MTSNIGSQYIQDVSEDTVMRERVLEALRGHFRPEFLNRVDDIVIFHRLTQAHLREIADIQLNHVRQLLAKRGISIALTEAASDMLIAEGYDPVYGARPLKRVLQRQVLDPLALKLIQGEVRDGDHVLVEVENGELSFEVVATAVMAEPLPA